jgi:starch synthase
MKILYISFEDLSLHKGSTVHVKEIVDGLRKLGHQVGLVARASDRYEGVGHFYNLYHGKFFWARFLGLKRTSYFISSILLFLYLIKLLPQYEIVYARDFHTVIIALLPRLFFNRKLVFEINGIANEEQQLKSDSMLNRIFTFSIRKAEKMASKYSDRIVAVTPHIASYLTQHFFCPSDKIEIVNNGVNTKIFRPIHDESLLSGIRKRLGIEENEIVLIFVGNLAPWQGIEYLIQVAPAIVKKVKNVKFLIIGDGVLKKDLEAEVKRLRVLDDFIFTGMVDHQEIPLYINIADICLIFKRKLKSGYSPIKLYEYMACGKPVLSSRVEGLEFIEKEGVGQLTEPEDPISLEEGLLALLRDPQNRMNMGIKGLWLARKRFDWEICAAKVGKILEKLA